MTKEALEKLFEKFTANAKIYTGRKRLTRGRSSLHMIIRTKEQAERFMKKLRAAEAEAEAEKQNRSIY